MTITAAQLREATTIQEQIDSLIIKRDAILGLLTQTAKRRGRKPGKVKAAKSGKRRKKRKMSAAGRAAIIAAQKKRWAKIKAGKK